MSVLILSADQKQAVPIVQSLGKRGIPVGCLSPNPLAPAFFSKYCSEIIHFPGTRDRERYAEFLKTLVKEKSYRLLIPCSDYSTLLVSELSHDLLHYTKVWLPSHDWVRTVTSKAALMRFAELNRISVPTTYFPKDALELKQMASDMTYPLVIKGDVTAGAVNVRYVRRKVDLVRIYNDLHKTDKAPILQQYIDGKEFMFYGLCKKGKVVAFVLMEIIRSWPPSGGTPAKTVTIFDAKLKEFAFNLIERTKWTGVVSLDIKQDRLTRDLFLLDFNPRFGATTFLAIKSGIDFPYLLYQLAVEENEQYIETYTKEIYRSLFREDLFYAAKRPWMVPKLLLEFLDHRVYYGYDKEDPEPFYRMAKNAVADMRKAIFT